MKPVSFPNAIAEKLVALRQESYTGTILLDSKEGVVVAIRHMEETKA